MPGKENSRGKETIYTYAYPVEVNPSARSKRIILRADTKRNCFVLTVPMGCPREEALRFLALHEAWMEEVGSRELQKDKPLYRAGEKHMLLGEPVTLGQDGIPEGAAFLQMRAAAITDYIRRILPAWEMRTGIRIRCIRWRNMNTRWGSCNSKTGEIHLASKLQMYPPACVELVLLHEMCHMRHSDHSEAFYRELARWIPDHRERARRLREFDPRPILP